MPKARLEAFSDGVFAIAITLLVLEIKVPTQTDGHLARALADQWPHYAAYLVSFFVLGIMWVNHHAVFEHVVQVDRTLLFVNLLLLLFVAVIPFPTALLAEYIKQGGTDSHVAAAVYSVTMLLTAISFNLLWRQVARSTQLLHPEVDLGRTRSATIRFSVGLFAYAATIGLSFASATVTLLVHFLIAVFYIVDQLPGRRRLEMSGAAPTSDELTQGQS